MYLNVCCEPEPETKVCMFLHYWWFQCLHHNMYTYIHLAQDEKCNMTLPLCLRSIMQNTQLSNQSMREKYHHPIRAVLNHHHFVICFAAFSCWWSSIWGCVYHCQHRQMVSQHCYLLQFVPAVSIVSVAAVIWVVMQRFWKKRCVTTQLSIGCGGDLIL